MASAGSQSEVEILEDEDEPATEEQVLEYAEFLGMDLPAERHLLWIAREGVAAPVPSPWKTCTEKGEVFYFNFETEESSWDHPCDGHYRDLLEEQRSKGEKLKVEEGKDTPISAQRKQKSSEGAQATSSSKEDDEDASFVSEMVGSDSEASSRRAVDSGAAWSDSSPRSASAHPTNSSEGGAAEDVPEIDGNDKAEALAPPEAKPELEPPAAKATCKTSKTLAVPESRGIGLRSLKEDSRGVVDHEPLSSNISEVSEDFRSDWGAPSPLGSGAGGLSREAHSLEVSTSGDAGSLSGAALSTDRPQTSSPQAGAVKSWASLHADLASLREVLASAAKLREQQAAVLSRLKG